MKKVLIGLVVLYLLFILSVIVRENRKKDYELNSNPEITQRASQFVSKM